jgi:hypothetical protein
MLNISIFMRLDSDSLLCPLQENPFDKINGLALSQVRFDMIHHLSP